jgi:integrase
VARSDVVTGGIADAVDSYIALRRGLGYRSVTQQRALRAFGRFLDSHQGPIPLEVTLDWATASSSGDPRNPARRLAVVRGFLRHLHGLDDATDVPAPGLLGPTGQRTPPHVYSDIEIADLMDAANQLDPPGGLRPICYATLFGLLACTGLRISEALALTCGDVDLDAGVITVRAGKRGLTRLVPLHATAVTALAAYADERERRHGCADTQDAFFRTDWSDRIGYNTAHHAFSVVRRRLGWTADGRTRVPRIHDLRHRMVVRRIQVWHAEEADVDARIAALATYLGHIEVRDVYWYLSAVPELMNIVGGRFETFSQRPIAGAL